ncbi:MULTISPECIES: Na(+)/H(+) antiporter subunit B [Marinobacter]|uniref:Sodium:proton antiporter n=1 Tax=Marinobacter profundi TaxID=2666256 RepID=A0A2G1UN44_9GAMM|nr:MULTISPECIES: Na(+)/H(+) antiporter subunit B [Marinobacter]MBD3657182.1 Na(+)/H(+) antiporter subunit B [Marinobacter sp.]PHQ15830.1 sodium:proton antiporter [Marinobacter profundi]
MMRLLASALAIAVCLVFAGALAAAVWQIAGTPAPVSLPGLLADNLAASGVEHPVTAVLLNFRSYDTLLEIGVLVIAGIAGISMARTTSLEDPELRTSDSLLYALQRWFVPLMLVLAGYLLWAGSDRPGGAFQAGAVLAASGVMMRLGGIPMPFLRPGLLLRLGLALGFTVFLLVAVASAAGGEAFLAYPKAFTKPLILAIETVLTFSIAMVLLALFVSAPVNQALEPEEGDPG